MDETKRPDPGHEALPTPLDEDGEPRYGDFLLVDLLNPDWRHFFRRYKVDLIGFAIVATLCALIVIGTWFLTNIGRSPAGGA